MSSNRTRSIRGGIRSGKKKGKWGCSPNRPSSIRGSNINYFEINKTIVKFNIPGSNQVEPARNVASKYMTLESKSTPRIELGRSGEKIWKHWILDPKPTLWIEQCPSIHASVDLPGLTHSFGRFCLHPIKAASSLKHCPTSLQNGSELYYSVVRFGVSNSVITPKSAIPYRNGISN